MPIIIHITRDTLVAHESAFQRKADGATITDLVIPRPARTMLGIERGITVRALYHAGSATYAFTYNWTAYRAYAPIPVAGLEASDHWQGCKPCRDGHWCREGQRLIDVALGSEA